VCVGVCAHTCAQASERERDRERESVSKPISSTFSTIIIYSVVRMIVSAHMHRRKREGGGEEKERQRKRPRERERDRERLWERETQGEREKKTGGERLFLCPSLSPPPTFSLSPVHVCRYDHSDDRVNDDCTECKRNGFRNSFSLSISFSLARLCTRG